MQLDRSSGRKQIKPRADRSGPFLSRHCLTKVRRALPGNRRLDRGWRGVTRQLHSARTQPYLLSPDSRVWRVRKRLGAMEFGLPSRRRIITISSLVIFHPQTRAAEPRSLSLLVGLLASPRNLSEYIVRGRSGAYQAMMKMSGVLATP